MLVHKGDLLYRDGRPYNVVAADEERFIVGELLLITDGCGADGCNLHAVTKWDDLMAYLNDGGTYTLEDLGFSKQV